MKRCVTHGLPAPYELTTVLRSKPSTPTTRAGCLKCVIAFFSSLKAARFLVKLPVEKDETHPCDGARCPRAAKYVTHDGRAWCGFCLGWLRRHNGNRAIPAERLSPRHR